MNKTKAQLEAIYEILQNYGGASAVMKESFIYQHTKVMPCEEWRFGGRFGFGGKYRIGKNEIDYYSENHTPELDKLCNEINEKLKAI